jgi:hypothetical protein
LSKSLPSSRGQGQDTTSFYSAVSEWEATTSVDSSRTAGITNPKGSGGGDSSTSTIAVAEGDLDHDLDTSDESIKRITDSSNNSSEGLLFYSCFKSPEDDSTLPSDPDSSTDFPAQIFRDEAGKGSSFRTFLAGESFKLIILDHFLYEVDPAQGEAILCKWDLKSLKSINEESVNKEAESTEFRLTFDTLRRQWRERSFIMSSKDYSAFYDLASTFLQVRTLHEFDGYQCVKCNSRFSKGMAPSRVVGLVPKEVPICPYCQSEFLIPLESIPLPNNESIAIDDSSAWGPRTSTPLSGKDPGL